MRPVATVMLVSLFAGSIASLEAQVAADPSGHWEGSVQGMARFEVDFARNAKGELTGTVSLPDEGVRGLPLIHLSIEDGTIAFYARGDQRLQGVFSDDGKSVSGDYSIEGFSIPFTMTRTGEAKVEPLPRSTAVTRDLEGRWNGTLNAGTGSLRLLLTLSNQPDGSAIGTLVNLDQGGLTLPLVITQRGSNLSLEVKAVSGTYSGSLNADGTELVGQFSQGPASLPLTFRRAARGKD